MARSDFIKTACAHCHGRIEFPSTALGTEVRCPHCSQFTELRDLGATTALKAKCPHCAGRIAFPPEAAGSAINCPHCGKGMELASAANVGIARSLWSWLSRRKSLVAVVAVLSVILMIAGGRIGKGHRDEVELRRFGLEPANSNQPARVVGKVINHGSSRFYSVRVEFEILDAAGKVVGEASDYLAILEPKDSWEFKAEAAVPGGVSVRWLRLVKER